MRRCCCQSSLDTGLVFHPIHGTLGAANLPILGSLVASSSIEPSSHPAGEPILIQLDGAILWPSDPQLWHVVATRGMDDQVLPIEWTVISVGIDSVAVIIQTNLLPLDSEFAIWVRTPTGDVLVATYLLYPY